MLFYFQPPSEPAPAAAPAAPAAAASEPADADALPKYKRDLAAKARVLRAELQALQPQTGHCRIEVRVFLFLFTAQTEDMRIIIQQKCENRQKQHQYS